MSSTTYTIVLLVALAFVAYSCQNNTSNSSNETVQSEAVEESLEIEPIEEVVIMEEVEKLGELLKYNLVAKEDISYSNVKRMVFRVVLDVESIPVEEDIKATVQNIWENGNKNWNEFTVFAYLPEMPTNNIAYAIGEFRPYGIEMFKINDYSTYGTKWE